MSLIVNTKTADQCQEKATVLVAESDAPSRKTPRTRKRSYPGIPTESYIETMKLGEALSARSHSLEHNALPQMSGVNVTIDLAKLCDGCAPWASLQGKPLPDVYLMLAIEANPLFLRRQALRATRLGRLRLRIGAALQGVAARLLCI